MDFTKKRRISENERFRFRVFLDRVTRAPSLPMEYHNEYEIAYILEGKGAYQVENTLHAFQPGDLILLLPNERHICYGLDHAPYTAYILLFDASVFERFPDAAEMCALLSPPDAQDGDEARVFHHKYTVPQRETQTINTLMEQLYGLSLAEELPLDCRMNMIAGLVGTLMYQISKLHGAPLSAPKSAQHARQNNPLISQAIQFINQHYDEDITLDILAAHLYVNPSYLSRTFKKNTGYPVVSYINIKRIMQARYYLSETSLPITQIALLVGFSTISYFSVVFKRMVGCSPNVYRQSPQSCGEMEPQQAQNIEKTGQISDRLKHKPSK